jgi:hypothetical protein
MKKLWTQKLCILSKQTTLPFGLLQSEVLCNLQIERTLSDVEAKISGQVRKKVVQNCFRKLDKLFTVRPNLSGQYELRWKSAEHESSSLFRGEQLWSLHNFNPRSFTTSKKACNVQTSFWPNSFGNFRPTHLNLTQTRVGSESSPLSCTGRSSASYIRKGWWLIEPTPIEQTHLQLFVFIYLSPVYLPCFSFFVVLQDCRQRIYEALGAVRPT